MMKPSKEAQQLEALGLAQQAEEWRQILLTAGPKEEAAFWAWIEKSPLHLREILLADVLDSALDHVDPERRIDIDALIARAKAASNIAPLEHAAPSNRAEMRQSRSREWVAIAATALLMVGGFAIWKSLPSDRYETAVGEQRMLELEDGSVVFLNTKSKIRSDFSAAARDIYLNEGQALFQVKHDALRPFRVHTKTATIQAIGTQFDVRLYADRTSVAVVEGTVAVISEVDARNESKVDAPPQPTRVTAGEGATISVAGKISSSAPIDTVVATAWRRQQLIFRDDTLGFIAGEFNRYNSVVRLRVEDGASEKRFNGVFNAHSPDSFVKFLAEEQDLEFERHGDEVVIRERRSDGSSDIRN